MLKLEGSGAEPLEDGDPRWIGPVPLIGRLGSGGMGRVYLGVHEGRYAAVKQLLPSVVAEDEDFLRRFGHELDNLARLPAEATAPLLVGDREARPPWFATAYVPGITLTEALEAHGGPLPARALWLVLREAARGLAAVHALDMVHRDLKPSNVMLTLEGLTLIDFGVARAAEQSQLTRTGMVVGTPAYMSPEQASGKRASSGVVDVFALGSVLAYAASGRPPFGDESGHAVLYRIVHEEPDLGPLRDLDPELAGLVASCLDKDHEGRPTAADLLDAAERHGPYEPPLWPRAVTEPLAERAAFVGTLPEAADLPEPEPEPAATGGPVPERRGHRRRNRVFLGVVPIVVATGATLAFQLLPYASGPDRAEAGTPPTPSASAAPDPTGPSSPSASSSASGRPSPSPSPSKSGTGQDTGKGRGKDDGNGAGADGTEGDGGGGADRAGGAGTTRNGGSARAGAGGDSSGDSGSAGDSSGSGSGSGGSSGTGGPSTGGGSKDGGTPSSGTFALKNGENGKCLVIGAGGWVQFGSCGGPAAAWTFRDGAEGAVKIVSQSAGVCLSANMIGQNVVTQDCTDYLGARLWIPGSGSTLKSVFNDGCLALGFGGNITSQPCEPGTAAQRWTRL
ncbi:serine/threonine-protein kinase [Streptomyces ardesiacus]|uniref:serine/threonine-protein kinase n=1 Tax=Streptomyces ardesiacus TaxID=285564 RepID=UPI00201F9A57|nr:serine/threonine protein kinase [Streptomyces ardesiacus]MCL7366366.1 serine/threonine protein kinase [Streptomyces ardesiacus]